MKIIRDYLKRLREEKQITQKEAGDALELSESMYSLIEAGKRRNHLNTIEIMRLSSLYDVSAMYLIQEENNYIKERDND